VRIIWNPQTQNEDLLIVEAGGTYCLPLGFKGLIPTFKHVSVALRTALISTPVIYCLTSVEKYKKAGEMIVKIEDLSIVKDDE
jgi:hypothetical protein